MQVVVKKSVLFNLLKNALNEASRSDYTFYSDNFLGKFEEEEEEKTFIDKDVPLVANPRASFQITQEKPAVADPEYMPASKSGFLAAVTAVLENIPDRQIEFAYQRVHDLLDDAMEKEDELNYGKLEEGLRNLFLSESRDFYIKQSAEKVRNEFADAMELAAELIQSNEEFEGEDDFELGREIEDAAYSSMGFDMSAETQDQETSPELEQLTQQISPVIRRRQAEPQGSKKPEPVQPPPAPIDVSKIDIPDVEKIDITNMDSQEAIKAAAQETIRGLSLIAMAIESLEYRRFVISATDQFSPEEKARRIKELPHVKHGIQNYKTFFIHNYDTKSRPFSSMFKDKSALAREVAHQIAVTFKHGTSFLEAPSPEYQYVEDPEVDNFIPDDASSTISDLGFDAKRSYDKASNKEDFMNGYNAGADFDPDLGSIPDMTGKSTDYKSGFIEGHSEFYDTRLNLNESKTRVETLDSQTAGDIFKQKVGQIKLFKSNITELQKKLGTSFDMTIHVLSDEVSAQMMEIVSNVNYDSDEISARASLFGREFASTTVYATGPAAGPGGSKKATAKSYQRNNTANFANHVKEEDREAIVADFLERLESKYYRNKSYVIDTGRDVPGTNKKEKYVFDPVEFRSAATEYANELITEYIQSQQSVPEEGEEFILDASEMVDSETKRQLQALKKDEEAKKQASGFFAKYAEEFGTGSISGFRQDYLKYTLRFLQMMVHSLKGDRVLIDFHSQTLKQILFILSKKISEIVADGDESTPEAVFENEILVSALSDLQQAIAEIRKQRSVHLSDITVKAGNLTEPFVYTPGGYLARSINGEFFRDFLREFDRDYTNFVVDRIMNDKTIQKNIQENIEASVSINPKLAKSLAEYWTGKKASPVLVKVKEKDEFGDTYEKIVYAKNVDGEYPRKGGAEKLMAAGIDGELYHYIFQKTTNFFRKSASFSFMDDYQRSQAGKESEAMKNYREKLVSKVAKFEEQEATNSPQINSALKDLMKAMTKIEPEFGKVNPRQKDE